MMTLLRALVELKLVSVDAVNRVVEEVTGTSTVDPSKLLTVYPEYIETVSKLIPKDARDPGARSFAVAVVKLNTMARLEVLNPTDRQEAHLLPGGALGLPHRIAVAGHEMHLASAIAEHYGVATNGLPAASDR